MVVGVRDSPWKAELQARARLMVMDMTVGKTAVGRKDLPGKTSLGLEVVPGYSPGKGSSGPVGMEMMVVPHM